MNQIESIETGCAIPRIHRESIPLPETENAGRPFIITIDGKSGAGKSELATALGQQMVLQGATSLHFDTGLLYRAVTHAYKQAFPQGSDIGQLTTNQKIKFLEELPFEIVLKDGVMGNGQKNERIRKLSFYQNGEELNGLLRENDIDDCVSSIAGDETIRKWAEQKRNEFVLSSGVDYAIIDARDVGTIGFPDADLKIYLEKNIGQRAARRFFQKNKAGEEISYELVLSSLQTRDELDMSRKGLGRLQIPSQAISIDQTNLTTAETALMVLGAIANIQDSAANIFPQASMANWKQGKADHISGHKFWYRSCFIDELVREPVLAWARKNKLFHTLREASDDKIEVVIFPDFKDTQDVKV